MASNVNVKAVITAQDKASSVVKGVGSNVSATATKIGAAMAIAGAGLTLFAKNATDFTVQYVKDIKDIQRETGATAEESSGLLYVTKRLGVEATEASQSFGFFSKQIIATKDSTDAADTALGKLGITVKKADGQTKSFNDILLETSDKFKVLPDGAEKTAIAMELFGRAGKDMIPFLNQGSDGIKNLQVQADKLGLTLNSNTITQISRLVESQKNLNDSTTALKLAIGETTAPILTEFNSKLTTVITSLLNGNPVIRDMTAGFLAFGGPVLSGAGAMVAFAANLGTIITTAGAASKAVSTFTVATIANLTRLRLAFLAFASTVAVPIVLPALAIGAAIASITKVRSAIIGAHKAWDDATRSFEASSQNQTDAFSKLQGMLKDARKRGDKKAEARILGSIRAIATPGIERRAGGGSVMGGNSYMVGEKGPETFVPNNSGTIIPNKSNNASNVTINVNAGAFMGSQQDARKYAQMIMSAWQDLQSAKGIPA